MITGASSGIGRSCAIECSRLGARVVLVARRNDELEKTLALLDGNGHRVAPFDLLDTKGISTWFANLSKELGPFDGLVHAAGIVVTMPIKATSEELYNRILHSNLDTSYWVVKAFRQRHMHAANASIVLIASTSGTVGMPGYLPMCVKVRNQFCEICSTGTSA